MSGEESAHHQRSETSAYGVPVPVITPQTHISVTLWRAGVLVGLIVAGAISGLQAYNAIQASVARVDAGLVNLRADVAKLDPAGESARVESLVEKRLRGVVIQCARQVRRGEVTGPCRVVFPAGESE